MYLSLYHVAEHPKSQSATLPSSVPSCRSLSPSEDGPSGHSSLSGGELARNLQESVRHRILYLSEQLRVEKASRDKNTVGYLKLVFKADRHQAPHIRQAFEKVNQRVSATIAQIERRLRQYHQQLQELEECCRAKGLVLKAESSLDNCEQLSERAPFLETPKSGRKDGLASNLSEVTRHFTLGKFAETKRTVQQHDLLVQKMKEELTEVKKLHLSLQVSCEGLKEKYQADLQLLLEALQEKTCR
nr:testis-specific protein TEX28 [Loxodonta africana]